MKETPTIQPADGRSPDQWWDTHLRQMGPVLNWPAEPTTEQMQSWKCGAALSGAMTHSCRLVRYVATAGAMAAMLLVGVVIWSAVGQPVSANTIFQKLHQALDQPLRLNLEQIPIHTGSLTDGVVSGQVLLGTAESHQAYAELLVDVPGLESGTQFGGQLHGQLEVRVGLSPQEEWIYLRLHNLSGADGQPVAADTLLYRTARLGVYLRIPGTSSVADGVLYRRFIDPLKRLSDRAALAQLVTLIEQHAEHAEVSRTPEGFSELRATGLYAGFTSWLGPSADLSDFSFLQDAQLHVTYHPDQGIRQVEAVSASARRLTWRWDAEGWLNPQQLTLAYQQQQCPAMVVDLAADFGGLGR
ncbi:MAG: hypothetical protein HJJLKODD_02474 [Phycisphaerae bacterium]|nr:hypothetical protein [Phycisphaerae bacterium]